VPFFAYPESVRRIIYTTNAIEALNSKMGLSDILCARPVSSLADEPIAEDNGELGPGLEPFARRSFPFLGRVVQHQV